MDDIHRLAAIYRVKPSAFFDEDGSTKKAVLIDGGVLDNASSKDRQRILGYLRDCAVVFLDLPQVFSEPWVECLKVTAATLNEQSGSQRVGRVYRQGRRKQRNREKLDFDGSR
jgi:hypothetical protein